MTDQESREQEPVRPMNHSPQNEAQVTLQDISGEQKSAEEISSAASRENLIVSDAVTQHEPHGSHGAHETYEAEFEKEENKTSDEDNSEQNEHAHVQTSQSVEEEKDVREILDNTRQTDAAQQKGIGWYVGICVFILIIAFLSYKIITIGNTPVLSPVAQPSNTVIMASVASADTASIERNTAEKNTTSTNASTTQPQSSTTPDADDALAKLADNLGK